MPYGVPVQGRLIVAHRQLSCDQKRKEFKHDALLDPSVVSVVISLRSAEPTEPICCPLTTPNHRQKKRMVLASSALGVLVS
jgi:hypothetical protein